jgi:hypothetical protein
VVDAKQREADSGFVWGVKRISGVEHFVLRHEANAFQMALPASRFTPEQRLRLYEAVNDAEYTDLPLAA